MDKSSLGDRMKNYESVSKTRLVTRMPVIIRLDGKAFHTWTKRLQSTKDQIDPFNDDMHEMMTATSQFLAHGVQNAVLTYTQSDEISILLTDWQKLNTDQWFGNGVQKIASVSASMATASFNFIAGTKNYIEQMYDMALFDSRVFNVPKEDVVNYFLWRQQDATRNSVQMLGQHHFSHTQMQGKNVSQVQDMLMDLETPVNWNDLNTWKKRGTCVLRKRLPDDACTSLVVDEEIPIFSQDRAYIEQLLQSTDD